MKKLLFLFISLAAGAINVFGDYYVDFGKGDDVNNNGLSADSPFKTIFKAVECTTADGGGTILLADGTHELNQADPRQVTLSVPTIVKSISGDPSRTIVLQKKSTGWGQPPARCFEVTCAGCQILDLTIDCNGKGLSGSSGTKGGAICLAAGGCLLSNCIVKNGATSAYGSCGGGVYSEGTADAPNRITRCVFTNCKVASTGTGDAIRGDYTTVDNCLVYGCVQGNKVVDLRSSSKALNCTIVNNKGIGMNLDAESSAVNCLLVTSADSTASAWTGTAASYNTCFTGSGAPINDTCRVYSASELFADFEGGDYTLKEGSPALNAGVTYEGVSDKDLAGNPRTVLMLDLGCYEDQSMEMQVSFEVTSLRYGKPPFEASFAAKAMGGSGTGYTYAWDFENTGVFSEASDSAMATHVYETLGTYPVTVRVTDSSGATKDCTVEDCIKCSMLTAVYVKAGSQYPEEPYDTLDCAAANIPEAVRFAGDGATVMVMPSDRSYKISSPIVVTNGVRIVGGGTAPAGVVVENTADAGWNNKYKCVFQLNNKDALLSNLTIENGKTYYRGGNVDIMENGGVVSNCVIRGGFIRENDAGGANIACKSADGLVTHCTIVNGHITDNANSTKDRATGVYMTAGRLENCLMTNNYVTAGQYSRGVVIASGTAQVLNCTVIGNTGKTNDFVGIRLGGTATARNCVMYGNTRLNPEGGTEAASWGGTAANFDHCASENAEPINETCRLVTSAAFRDYANGDYTPVSGGGLCNAGVTPEGWERLTDLAGGPRVIGRAVDIGCYEAKLAGMLLIVR